MSLICWEHIPKARTRSTAAETYGDCRIVDLNIKTKIFMLSDILALNEPADERLQHRRRQPFSALTPACVCDTRSNCDKGVTISESGWQALGMPPSVIGAAIEYAML